MAEDSGPLKQIATVVPSVYYDLIARVAAGATILAIATWPAVEAKNLHDVSWAQIGLLTLAAYVVGLLVTSFSMVSSVPMGWLICGVLWLVPKRWSSNVEPPRLSNEDNDKI